MEPFLSFAKEWLQVPWVRAVLLIAGSFVAAWVVDFVLCRLLLSLASRTRTDLDEQVIHILHRPIRATVVFIGLFLAGTTLELPYPYGRIVVGILATLAIILWAGALLRVSRILLAAWSPQPDRMKWVEDRTLPLFDNLAKVLIIGGAFYGFLVAWNLNLGPWLASAGIVGIAVGFAAKDTLANLFGGLFVIADAPYKLGDFIILDTGERGRVTRIGLRSTRLLTRDDIEITLPNAQIANAKITNESGGPWEKERVRVEVGVAYGSDVDQVRRALLESAASVEHVVADPEPRVRFTQFGDSALVFQLQCWIDEPVLRGRCIDGLHTAVYKRFMEAGIQIPFPQHDVYIKEMPGGRA